MLPIKQTNVQILLRTAGHSSIKLRQLGFTLIELIMVIAIVGILAVAIVPSWTGTSLGVVFEARRVLNDIRYVQALSMTSGQRYRWVQQSPTSYSILNEAGSAVILPNGSTTVTLTNGVTMGLSNLPNGLVAFDSLGVPYVTSNYPGTALASTASISLTAAGNTYTIQITPQTGYGALS